MAYIKKADRRKNQHQKVSFDFKLSVINEIQNGLISNYIYNLSKKAATFIGNTNKSREAWIQFASGNKPRFCNWVIQ